MTTAPSTISYRADIQGLRAVAIALVLLAHAHVPGFAGGYIGVDVFFVLSGYLITSLLVREHTSTGGIRYVRFLARRLKRLLPALLMMLILVLVAASLLLSAYETRIQSGSFLFSATWTSNIFFAFVDRDYFSALQSKDLFLHTWSLGIEEQFYLVWPWLVSVTFLLMTGEAGVNRDRNVLLGVFAVVFAGSLLLCLYWSKTQPLLAFYMMPSRGWQFALGAAVFVWFQDTGREQQAATGGRTSLLAGLPIGITGLLLIVGSAVLLKPNLAYPGYFALFPSLGAAMVIAAGIRSQKGVSGVMAHRYFVWLGDLSYSLYLWHWPVFIFGNSFGLASTPVEIASLVGISVLLAILSYKLIELPFWKGQFSSAKPARTILISALAMVAVVGASESLKRNFYGISAKIMTADSYDPRVDASMAIYKVGRNCDMGHFNAHVIPCGIGAPDGESLAVLFGDSIGAQWSTLVSGIFSAPDWQVIVLTKSACAIVDETYYYDKVGADYEICAQWRKSAIEYIGDIKPDVVIVGSAANYDFSESQWVDGTSRVLSKLTAAADNVVIIPGTPELSFDGPSCLEEPYRFSFRLRDSRRECEEAMSNSRSDEVLAYLQRSADGFPNAHVLDMSDLVCPDRRCAARREDGVTVFRDEQHLTMSFVNSQIPAARGRLMSMGIKTQTIQSPMDSLSPD